jgi:cytochrome b561
MIKRLRAWGNSYTKRGRYSPVGIAFHWIMALLILFQLGWGFWTDVAPAGGDKLSAYQVHSSVGLAILLLALPRMAWRTLITDPYNDADRQGFQTKIAHVTAILFYLSFFILPISGWLMWSSVAPPGPLYVGGLIPWPQVPLDGLHPITRYAVLDLAEDVHIATVILLLVLIPAHVGAALKHHFWDRHDVLKGMLPEISDWEGHPEAEPHIAPASAVLKASAIG